MSKTPKEELTELASKLVHTAQLKKKLEDKIQTATSDIGDANRSMQVAKDKVDECVEKHNSLQRELNGVNAVLQMLGKKFDEFSVTKVGDKAALVPSGGPEEYKASDAPSLETLAPKTGQ